jgi:hypothetical protein
VCVCVCVCVCVWAGTTQNRNFRPFLERFLPYVAGLLFTQPMQCTLCRVLAAASGHFQIRNSLLHKADCSIALSGMSCRSV